MFSLTTTHLRFVCTAITPLRLEVENFRAGQNLRGGLGQVMTRTYCAGDWRDPTHTATCPVHWLLAANEKPGEERRGYTLVPPRDNSPSCLYEPGQRFEFGITLFGHTLKFLPYFVLAVPEMGRAGVGPGRGKFTLNSVWAENPLTQERECLLAEGANLVHTPTLILDDAQVQHHAAQRLPALAARDGRLVIQFTTPTRVIRDEHTLKSPELGTLFASLLKRLDDLAEQHANGNGRPHEAIVGLQNLAAQVQLIETEMRWVEVWSGSTRRGASSPMGGLVGRAVYVATLDVWREVLPWLIWGQLAQIGKDTVKGNGVIKISD